MTEIRSIERTWRRLGVPTQSRQEMAAELAADLAASAADGGTAVDVVGPDPTTFAREWAEARGEVRGRWRLGLVTVAVILGAVPGAVFGLFIAYGTSSEAFASLVGNTDGYVDIPGWLSLSLYGVGGILALAGALLTTSAALRSVDDPHPRRTVRLLAVVLPIAAILGVAAAMTYGDRLRFSTAPPTPEIEALLVVAAVGFGGIVSRVYVRWRSGRRRVCV